VKRLFLDIDDGLGAAKLERQTLVVAQQLSVFGRERMDRRALGSALDRLQRLIGAGVALATPVGHSRRIEPLASKDGAAAARPGAVDLGQDPNLVGRRERPSTARPVDKFGRRRR